VPDTIKKLHLMLSVHKMLLPLTPFGVCPVGFIVRDASMCGCGR